jgi:hypothetical protein
LNVISCSRAFDKVESQTGFPSLDIIEALLIVHNPHLIVPVFADKVAGLASRWELEVSPLGFDVGVILHIETGIETLNFGFHIDCEGVGTVGDSE